MANVFGINKPFLPLNIGYQFRLLGAGGPSGFPHGTAQIKPWPYQTGFINFITPGPFGASSTLAATYPWPYRSSNPQTIMQGVVKTPTFGNVVF